MARNNRTCYEAYPVPSPNLTLSLTLLLLTSLHPTPPSPVMQQTGILAEQLRKLLDLCIPSDSEVSGDLPLEVLGPAVYLQGVFTLNEILKQADSSSSSGGGSNRNDRVEFLGCMPINLSRRNLLTVQRNPSYLAEKSDGVRYLMYVIANGASNGSGTGGGGGGVEIGQPIAVLMNRSCAVFSLPGR